MKLYKYKAPESVYNSFVNELRTKHEKSIRSLKFLKYEGGFAYFDIVWTTEEFPELNEFKMWKPFGYLINHGYIIETQYIKDCCDSGVEHPICGNINFMHELSESKKQTLIENGVDYYGH